MELTIEEKIKKASKFPGMDSQIKIRLIKKLDTWGNSCFPPDYKEHVEVGQMMWLPINDKYKFEKEICAPLHPSNNVFSANFNIRQFEVLGIYNYANSKTHYYDAKNKKFIKYVTSSVDEEGKLAELAKPMYKRLGIPLIPEGLDVHLFRCRTSVYENNIGFGIKEGSTVWAAKGHTDEDTIKLFNDVHSYNFPSGLFTYLGRGVGYGGDTATEELSSKIEEQTAEMFEMPLEQIIQPKDGTKEVFPVEKIKEQLEELKKLPLIPEDCFKTPNDADVSPMKNIEI